MGFARYNIDDSVTSKQLPTLILFQNGKEVKRRPVKSAGQNGKVFPFYFTKVCEKISLYECLIIYIRIAFERISFV